MITWIASYPKSGNTWVRSFLTNYISNNENFDFNQLRKINSFPREELFKQLNVDTSDIKNIASNWIPMQDFINLKNDTTYLKTHNAMATLNNYKFTNDDNTKGFVYLVRDPRDVVISYASHLGQSIEKTLDVMKGNLSSSGKTVLLGSWSLHYNSWKNSNFTQKIIVRYEDLVDNPDHSFNEIVTFLNKLNNLPIDKDKINKAILNTSFSKLKDLEKKYGFVERGKCDFFRKGEVGQWKKDLDKKIIQEIENLFHKEMKELGYL